MKNRLKIRIPKMRPTHTHTHTKADIFTACMRHMEIFASTMWDCHYWSMLVASRHMWLYISQTYTDKQKYSLLALASWIAYSTYDTTIGPVHLYVCVFILSFFLLEHVIVYRIRISKNSHHAYVEEVTPNGSNERKKRRAKEKVERVIIVLALLLEHIYTKNEIQTQRNTMKCVCVVYFSFHFIWFSNNCIVD